MEEEDEPQATVRARAAQCPGAMAAAEDNSGEEKLRERGTWKAAAMSAPPDMKWQREATRTTSTDAGDMQSTRTGMPVPFSPQVLMSRGLASPAFLVWHVDPRSLSLSTPLVRLGSF